MNMFILVISLTWSFGMGFNYGDQNQYILVSGPKAASIRVYENEQRKFGPEPDRHSYKLYKIDFKEMSIKEIPIPEMMFKESPDGD